MRTRSIVAAILALTLAALILPPAAAAAAVTRVSGRHADAFFSSVEKGVTTEVFVAASDNTFHQPPGAPVRSTLVAVLIRRCLAPACAKQPLLLDAAGQVAGGTFAAGSQLEAAAFRATVPVTDAISARTFTVTLDLAWLGTGALLVADKGYSHLEAPDFRVFVHGAVLRRDAVATGSVSDGTTNYTPAPSREAHLEAVKEGTVVID